MPNYLKVCVIALVIVAGCALGTGYGRDDLQLRMIKIAHGNGASICATAQAALSPDGKMSFDPRTATLVVVDRPDYLPHIGELVAALDVKAPTVEIAVRITEVTDEFIRKAGIHSAQLIFPRGSFDIVLGLLDSRTGVFTRSEMTLKTASGSPARLEVSREALYGAAVVEYPGATVTYLQRKDTGDFLEVVPYANNDNTVTVKLRPRRSSVQDDGSVSESTVLTQVTLHSGDTLAIGGVETQSDRPSTGLSGRKTMMFLTAQIIY